MRRILCAMLCCCVLLTNTGTWWTLPLCYLPGGACRCSHGTDFPVIIFHRLHIFVSVPNRS